jgi:hypothetical protein
LKLLLATVKVMCRLLRLEFDRENLGR